MTRPIEGTRPALLKHLLTGWLTGAARARWTSRCALIDRAVMVVQPHSDPLHGVTLQTVVERLVEHYGFARLAELVPVRCFQFDASVSSSLKFLRRTPWARSKVEQLYVTAAHNWPTP